MSGGGHAMPNVSFHLRLTVVELLFVHNKCFTYTHLISLVVIDACFITKMSFIHTHFSSLPKTKKQQVLANQRQSGVRVGHQASVLKLKLEVYLLMWLKPHPCDLHNFGLSLLHISWRQQIHVFLEINLGTHPCWKLLNRLSNYIYWFKKKKKKYTKLLTFGVFGS